MDEKPSSTKRPWFQFTLREFALLIVAIAACFAWWGEHQVAYFARMQRSLFQRAADELRSDPALDESSVMGFSETIDGEHYDLFIRRAAQDPPGVTKSVIHTSPGTSE